MVKNTSYRYEEQSRAHSGRAAVKSLLPVFNPANDHADSLDQCRDAARQGLQCCVKLKHAGCCTHRYEEDAAEQSPRECCFDDLFITSGAGAVSPQQCRDVERYLRDGAKSGVHHSSHCKITLCGEATDAGVKSVASTCFLDFLSTSHLQNKLYLAIPMPMK